MGLYNVSLSITAMKLYKI